MGTSAEDREVEMGPYKVYDSEERAISFVYPCNLTICRSCGMR